MRVVLFLASVFFLSVSYADCGSKSCGDKLKSDSIQTVDLKKVECEKTYKIENMSCLSCLKKIDASLSETFPKLKASFDRSQEAVCLNNDVPSLEKLNSVLGKYKFVNI